MRAMLLVVAGLVAGCKGKDDGVSVTKVAPAAAEAPTEGKPVKKGTLVRKPFAILGVIAPPGADTKGLVALATGAGNVEVEATTPERAGWHAENAEYYGSRYPAEDRPRLEKATFAITIKSVGRDARRRVGGAAVAAARSVGGWIVDLHQHQLYTADTIIEHLPGEGPLDVRKLIMVHQVGGEGELAFLDTAGMNELGFPEILVVDVPHAQINSTTNLVNAAAQTLLDRGDLTRDGQLDVDLSTLSGDWHLAAYKKLGGTGTITWQVTWDRGDAEPEEKLDPEQLEIKLTIAGAKKGTAEALVAASGKYFGGEPDEARSLDDYKDELAAAAVKARESLAKQRAHFAKGVPPGEQLGIKVPFREGENTEWMWVDVVGWKGDVIDGTLDNEPDMVKNVKLGQRVKVKFSEVADYIHQRADGTREGGFSLEVLRKHGEDVPPL